MEHYLIYVSTSNQLMSNVELLIILEQSREWNINHGITGMLIYIEGLFIHGSSRRIQPEITGRFMQILEGPAEEVERIFNHIKADTRHHNVIVLQELLESSRTFATWEMGFKSITADDFRSDPGYFDISQLPRITLENATSTLPLQFLQSFYKRGMSQTTLFSL